MWNAINEVELPNLKRSPEEQARRLEELARMRSIHRELQGELSTLVFQIPGGTEANVLSLEKPIAANEKGTEYVLSFKNGPSVWTGAPQRTTAADGLQIDLLREDGSVLAGFRHRPGAWSGTNNAQKLKSTQVSYTGDGSGGIRIRITSSSPAAADLEGPSMTS